MDIQRLAREVEEAADCFSWAPSVLRKWLAQHDDSTLFDQGLSCLVDRGTLEAAIAEVRRSAISGAELAVVEEALRLVVEGATPNAIRARLAAAAQVRPDRTTRAA